MPARPADVTVAAVPREALERAFQEGKRAVPRRAERGEGTRCLGAFGGGQPDGAAPVA